MVSGLRFRVSLGLIHTDTQRGVSQSGRTLDNPKKAGITKA